MDLSEKRAYLIVEMVVFLDVPASLVVECLDDRVCSERMTEVAETVEVGESV
jgi:hypothetical protein